MLQRDKIMEHLMFGKMKSGYLIQETITTDYDNFNKKTLLEKDIKVFTNKPGETMEEAKELQKQLMSNQSNSSTPIIINSIWEEVWNNLDNYIEQFFADKQRTKRKVEDNTVKNMRSGFKYFKLFPFPNKKPDLQFYKEVQNIMEMLPRDYLTGAKWRKTSIEKIVQNFDNSNYETLKPQTINKNLNFHKQFFAWLEYNDSKYETNMHKLLPLYEETEIVKFPYDNEDLGKIFSTDLDSEYRDFFNIALHTGMRLSEISSLKPQNISMKENTIELFKGKTKSAKRIIPIHSNIQNLLHKRLKKAKKTDFLLFNGNSSANGKKLNRVLNKIIPQESKTFHSFRKCFAVAMEKSRFGSETNKDILMGHSLNGSVRQKHYVVDYKNIELLREIIDNIVIDYE